MGFDSLQSANINGKIATFFNLNSCIMKNSVNTNKAVRTSPNEVAKQRANSKRKTIETRAKNRSANRSAKQAPVIAKKDGIVYLAEGVTSKMFTEAKKATNNEVKKFRASISQCIGDAYNNDKGFFESINLSKSALKKVCAPKSVLAHATDSQIVQAMKSFEKVGYVKFNVWYVLGWVKAELDGRKPNARAIAFFGAYDSNNVENSDVETMKKASKAAATAHAKAKKEAAAKAKK